MAAVRLEGRGKCLMELGAQLKSGKNGIRGLHLHTRSWDIARISLPH
jgi:hypothetical protein